MPVSDESVPDESPPGRDPGGGSQKGRKLAPQHLRDMRRVYKQPKSADESAAQKSLRKLMTDDFSKFIGMLQQAERAHEAAKAARAKHMPAAAVEQTVPVTEEDDEQDIEVDELIERCLADAIARK